MNKILAITFKELYTTFTDRNLLLIMIAAPLAISTIVGLVFGGFGSGDGMAAFANIPVAVVNLDEGAQQQGQQFNYGAMLTGFMVPGAETAGAVTSADVECTLVDDETSAQAASAPVALDDLLAAQQVDTPAAARAGVADGTYAAAIIIPADFSARMMPNVDPTGRSAASAAEPVAVEVYANSGQPIEGTIVRSVVEGFTNQVLTGNIAIGASINTLIQENPAAALRLATMQNDPAVGGIFVCGFTGALATIQVDRQFVGQAQTHSLTTLILVQTGSAQAVLFALFAGQFGVLSIIEERRAGTLQRMLATPTPRSIIVIGKLVGTFVMIIVQLLILLGALTLIASVVEGQLVMIWGSSLPALAALMIALALAVAGFGVLLTGIARTPEQVGPVGAIINIIMGAVGGAFGFAPVFPLAYLSFIYWGTDGFNKLAAGNLDIGLNLVVLLAAGALLFAVGLFLFNRRVEV